MNFLKRLRPICTKEMYEDLCFYLDHETELYFSEMFLIAAGYTVFTILFIILGVSILLSNSNLLVGILFIAIAVMSELGFGQIKMYLHIRKDTIEIKELILKGNK